MKVISATQLNEQDRIGRIVKRFLETHDAKTIAVGKHEHIEGSYVNVIEYETKDTPKFEAHIKYIDVQMLVEGEENILCAPLSAGKEIVAYNPIKDVTFYACEAYERVHATPYQAVILYPEDLHAPNMTAGVVSKNKKYVFKIPVEE